MSGAGVRTLPLDQELAVHHPYSTTTYILPCFIVIGWYFSLASFVFMVPACVLQHAANTPQR